MAGGRVVLGFRAICRIACCVIVLVVYQGCKEKPKEDPTGKRDPDSSPAEKILRKTDMKPWRVTGIEVLVRHAQAETKRPGVTRTREEALARAKEAQAKAKAPGVAFEEVVRQFSDEAARGGAVGILERDNIRPSYEKIAEALHNLKVGEISDILETPEGFHVVKRLEIDERAAAHIWIQYKGSGGASPTCDRTKEEAKKLAETVLQKARQPGADFELLVHEYSEDNDRLKSAGGFMGIFPKGSLAGGGTGAMGEALEKLEVGGISEVVESPFGFHILRRLPLEECRVAVSEILIQYAGLKTASKDITRSKEEARKLAEELRAKLGGEGADFEELARRYSDSKNAKSGGFRGYVQRGFDSEAIENVAFPLKPGEISPVAETPAGFLILWRRE